MNRTLLLNRLALLAIFLICTLPIGAPIIFSKISTLDAKNGHSVEIESFVDSQGILNLELAALKTGEIPVVNLHTVDNIYTPDFSISAEIDFGALAELRKSQPVYLGRQINSSDKKRKFKVLVNKQDKNSVAAILDSKSLYVPSRAATVSQLKKLKLSNFSIVISNTDIFSNKSNCYSSLKGNQTLTDRCPQFKYSLPYRFEYSTDKKILKLIPTEDLTWQSLGVYNSPLILSYGKHSSAKYANNKRIPAAVKAQFSRLRAISLGALVINSTNKPPFIDSENTPVAVNPTALAILTATQGSSSTVPTQIATNTVTITPSAAFTPSQTALPYQTSVAPTVTATRTFTAIPSPSQTAINTPTKTATITASQTATRTSTTIPTRTATLTPTASRTASNSPSPTQTATNTPTRTQTFTATPTCTATPTITVTATPTGVAVELFSSFLGHNQYGLQSLNFSFDSKGNATGEFHSAYHPPVDSDFSWDNQGPQLFNPLETPLLAMINNTPKGSWIRIAAYVFTDKRYSAALKMAIERGVIVQVVVSNAQELVLQKDVVSNIDSTSAASKVKATIEEAQQKSGNNNHSFTVCIKGLSDGACIHGDGFESKNHNKFFIFSQICRAGLTSSDLCAPFGDSNQSYYQDLVVQTSLNLSRRNIDMYNSMTVTFGNSAMYNAYVDYFNSLKSLSSQSVQQNFNFSRRINMPDSSLVTFNGLPRKIVDTTGDDIFISRLADVRCSTTAEKTTIKVANAHWTAADGERGDIIIERLGTLKNQGCTIKVLGSRDLSANGDYRRAYSKIVSRNIPVRSFGDAINKNLSNNLHTKFVVVNNNAKPGSPKNLVMYGSMSFTEGSHRTNDETWLIWENANSKALTFYNESFNSIWDSLS